VFVPILGPLVASISLLGSSARAHLARRSMIGSRTTDQGAEHASG
jgi:hypothetical protein